MNAARPRSGISSAGNWIVDRVKTVDRLPGRGMLANIRAEERSTGGAPANVLADLARLGSPFPLAGYGVIGRDDDGRLLRDRLGALGLDLTGLRETTAAPTSYTDVMNEAATGERLFFHHRGANALFGPEHVPAAALTCRIFHLGYLLLLDRMDAHDPETGTVAARVLRDVRAQGIRTSLDVVSEDSDRFRQLVPPALKHTDYLIVNEIEAGRIVGRGVRRPDGTLDAVALAAALDELMAMGVMEMTVVHMPEGACLRTRAGLRLSAGSLRLPPGFIQGAVGAGDAFCAGVLYGLHENVAPAAMLALANGCAAAALSRPGATEGVGPLADVRELVRVHGLNPPPQLP